MGKQLMKSVDSIKHSVAKQPFRVAEKSQTAPSGYKPLVSLVVPAYNEAAIVEENLTTLCQYMETLEDHYRWEVVVINDGSIDETGKLADAFSQTKANVRVLHHSINFGLGQAFRFGFANCRGDYIVTLDSDLSYAPDHIEKLLIKIRETRAKIVVTSPYMKGGRISNVPWLRRIFSIGANRFLSLAARGNLSTLTSMVRVYDGRFLRTLNLRSMGMEINPEIIYKAMLLRARIEEIPAHLNWRSQPSGRIQRRSSMRMLHHTVSVLVAGFVFRPFIFFIFPGFLLGLVSLYADSWVLIHSFDFYQRLSQYDSIGTRASAAVAAAFNLAPHTFIIGGMTMMLAIQLISLGILALQSKNYFEEIFNLGSTIYRQSRSDERSKA
jgi:glycosyltransferase involved in cell wall biosynthesis